MTQDSELCGIFGKIPQESDFISHHLPSTFTEVWHQWLQACLSISREQLEDAWLERYMVAPIWHFALMPEVASEHTILGIVIPSVDQMGRYFPLTIAHAGEHEVWAAYLYGQDWYKQAEDVALLALKDDVSYSELIGAIESTPIPNIEALPKYKQTLTTKTSTNNQVRKTLPNQNHNDFALSLLPQAYQQRYGAHSLWWTAGSETFDSTFIASSKLPDPGQFSALLDGQWSYWGWLEENIIE